MIVDQDVVEEDDNKTYEKWVENGVHEGLECDGGIGQTKRHDMEFIMPFMGLKCCHVNVRFMYQH